MSKVSKEINFKMHYEDLPEPDKKFAYWIGDRLYDMVLVLRKKFSRHDDY